MKTITYLRSGRKLRASGQVIWKAPDGIVKVKPSREGWGCVVISPEEIEAAKHKGPMIERKAPAEPKKRERKPKPVPVPRWKQMVERVRIEQAQGTQLVSMEIAVALAEELEAAQTLFKS
jgi:hypothetical protein